MSHNKAYQYLSCRFLYNDMAKRRRNKQKDKPPNVNSSNTPTITKGHGFKKKKKKTKQKVSDAGKRETTDSHTQTTKKEDQNSGANKAVVAVGETSTSRAVGAKQEVSEAGKTEKKEKQEKIWGFIFMCNGRTKPECFQNHVFGLSAGSIGTVEKIKPGATLFLYDFDLKLLYGIYEATSSGKLNLEPRAFQGRFPAQVRFKVCKDCLPLPESSFKRAIQDNYDGSKFKQDLSRKQVKALKLLFRPVACPVNAFSTPQATNPAPLRSFAAPVVVDHVQPSPNISSLRNPHILPIAQGGGRTVTGLQSSEPIPPFYDRYGQTNHASRMQTITEPRQAIYQAPYQHGSATYGQAKSLVPHPHHSSTYDQTEAHLPYVPENPGPHVQNPYGRYGVMSETFTRDQPAGYGREYAASQLSREEEIVPYPENYYSQNNGLLTRATSHPVLHGQLVEVSPYASSLGIHTSRQLPSSLHQSAAAAGYENPTLGLVDPLPRTTPAIARISHIDAQVSSRYSFAGATPSYR